jgi:hypothetical protein
MMTIGINDTAARNPLACWIGFAEHRNMHIRRSFKSTVYTYRFDAEMEAAERTQLATLRRDARRLRAHSDDLIKRSKETNYRIDEYLRGALR